MNLRDKLKKTKAIMNDDEGLMDGKRQGMSWYALTIFIPFTVVAACLLIIVAAVGIPSGMGALKGALDFAFKGGSQNSQDLHASANEPLFKDVDLNNQYFQSSAYLKQKGIVGGFEDGTFKAEQKLTRAELIKSLVTAKKQYPLHLNYNNCFKDVAQEWFAPSVCFAKGQGWISGFADNSFKPNEQLTRAETVKILITAFNLKDNDEDLLEFYQDVKNTDWYYDSVKVALKNDLLKQNPLLEFFEPEEKITRGEAFEILYKILN